MENFSVVEPRATVEVHLPDSRVIAGPRGAAVAEFLRVIEDPADPIVGAVINGELRELVAPIQMDARVRPITMSSADGAHIYRRSITFLLECAFETLFPNALLTIDHSVSFGAYFCRVGNHAPLTEEDLQRLTNAMQTLVEANRPILRRQIPINEAIAHFKQIGHTDKVRLLAHRQKDYLTLYELDGHKDYHHGYMLPSTGYLRWFGLALAEGGFILRFPRRKAPTLIEAQPPQYPKLLHTFRQYGDWLEALGIDSVGALNDAVKNGRTGELILVSEALQERHIAEIAAQIAARRQQVRMILIAGPSSSGKTTFSKRLAVQLLAQGISPFPLEMDNYFVDRDHTPRDENGDYDFESFDALDYRRLQHDLQALIAGESVQLPHFNFRTGASEPGETVQLKVGQMLIIEGIHGMNPRLLGNIPASRAFRVYISALTQLNLDRHNRISTTDTRLLRRIVRDARERGYSARDTIGRWESVRRGEKRNIFPYQENADVMFNSALVYELSAIKEIAEPLLRQVEYNTPEHIEAKRLLALLEWFLPIPSDLIPDNSILREFLGNSILKNFRLWKNGTE